MDNGMKVSPKLFEWAVKRSGKDPSAVSRKFKKYESWLKRQSYPSFKQLEEFARYVHVPVGYLFLESPPEERLPIADFRTMKNTEVANPSPNLLDTIYFCQTRQEWYREHSITEEMDSLSFVNAENRKKPIDILASEMRAALHFEVADRLGQVDFSVTRKYLVDAIENLGVLVMINGVVGNDTHRPLKISEFRGFALSDNIAPLIFVNAADTKSAQIFTLVHELVHIWIDQTGVSNSDFGSENTRSDEQWVNRVTAEILVQKSHLEEELRNSESKDITAKLPYIDTKNKSSGGNFYFSFHYKNSRAFVEAVVTSTLEGRTLYRDAFTLLGISGPKIFEKLVETVGIT